MNPIRVAHLTLGQGHSLCLIAGPCVVESPEVMRRTAGELRTLCEDLDLPLIFKSSYEKDNRTHADAPRGPGLEEGLRILDDLRREFGVPLLSDVHRPSDVPVAAAVLDMVQVPAFLCRQTSLLEAVGAAGRPVNLKKGQFMSPMAMAGSLDKLRRAGAESVLLTERGSCFGHDALVCDLQSIPLLQALGCPVALDAGHAASRRELIPTLARAGVAAMADALFIECHPRPDQALCDGSRMLDLVQMRDLLGAVAPLARLVRDLRANRPDSAESSF